MRFRDFNANPVLLLLFLVVVCLAAVSIALRNQAPAQKRQTNVNHVGEHVRVKGVVRFAPYVSTGGRPYEAFFLCNPACTLIFTHGHPHIQVGEWLDVSGTVAPYDGKGATQIVADNGSL